MAREERAIRFVLDGVVHRVDDDVAPTMTVLQYLRERLHRSGTKEGCAEGDCGACTVVLGELDGKRVRYRAVNACIQFAPTLDGKALLTVESLKAACGGRLHPVQQAMVDCHGSQCGFCTPGFVMSLFALYMSNRDPSDDDVRYALSGNLCRCTGYRPILAAAERMYALDAPIDDGYFRGLRDRLQAIRVTGEKRLDTPHGRYIAPSSVDELARCLQARPEATLLAGGTDVGLWVTKQFATLPDVVYVGNVGELKSVRRDDGVLDIGAAVTLSDAFAVLLEEYPDFYEVARRFGSPPICNAGTLCGNIANGSPIGDSMPGLICLGASVVLRRGAETRWLPLEDFYVDYMKKDLRPGEFVVSVRVPRCRDRQVFRSYKIAKRYDQDISAICAAFSVQIGRGRVEQARVAFGGMAATPKRAPACERALVGAEWNRATIERAALALADDYQPLTDLRASRDYRLLVARHLLERFQSDVAGSASATNVWNYGKTA